MLSRAANAAASAARAGAGLRGISQAAAGVDARVCAVMGGQWGDEGKGKLADVLAKGYDIVGRFNGGANAGHTVVVGDKKFAFHLLPCGLVYPHTQNILGNGTVIHLGDLFDELAPLDAEGIDWRGRLHLSDRATLLFDFHKEVDGVLEARRAAVAASGKGIGTTKRGIGPGYASKVTRNAVRVGHMKNRAVLHERLTQLVEDTRFMYDIDIDLQAELDKADAFADKTRDMVVDGVAYVNSAYASGKRIITEGANAAMLDIDYGTFPYVTSSSTTAGGIATGMGLSPDKIQSVVGVLKAYTTRVGEGPFPTELTDERGGGDLPLHAPGTDIGLHLQQVGAEVGVTTGRKRRCGWLDLVVAQYGHLLNNYSSLNITKLDVLDDLDEIRIGVGYKINGQRLPYGAMPAQLDELAAVEVEYETLPGWKTSIAHCKTWEELPPAAQAYVHRVEEVVGVPVSWIGVGPGREAMVAKGFTP